MRGPIELLTIQFPTRNTKCVLSIVYFYFFNILFFGSSNEIESKHARINLNFTPKKKYTILSTVFVESLSALLLPIFFLNHGLSLPNAIHLSPKTNKYFKPLFY